MSAGPANTDALTKEVALELAGIALDIGGLVDPTPICDGAGAVLAIAQGEWLSATLSVISMVPYVGDLAKLGKFPRYLKTLEKAINLARQSADAGKILAPVAVRVRKALDLLPDEAGPQLAKLRKKVDELMDVVGAKAAKATADTLPDISKQFRVRKFQQNGNSYHEVSGRLGVPGKVKTHRSKSAQSAMSSGTGDDAGHLIGDRFGAPGDASNLNPQNWIANRHGTYKDLENEWAQKLQGGHGIDVTVQDIMKAGETRPFARKVKWTETTPQGNVIKRERDFMNPHSEKSRLEQGIPPTVSTPQTNNVFDIFTGKRIP